MPRPRKFDETQVLELAREQFWATGFAGTRMDDIARATGLGKGSLYGAFGDKEALFHRVFDDWCGTVVALAEEHLSGPDEGALARLEAYVRFVAANTAADVGRRGCFQAKATAELAASDESVADRSATTLRAVRRLLGREIAAAQRCGHLAPGADPDALASLLLVVVRGVEAVGKAGLGAEVVTGAADAALALLPRP